MKPAAETLSVQFGSCRPESEPQLLAGPFRVHTVVVVGFVIRMHHARLLSGLRYVL